MKKLLVAGVGLLSILSACSIYVSTTDAKSETPLYKTYNLEDSYRYGGYVEDKRTGCLYVSNYGNNSSYLTPVYGANGRVVGCSGTTGSDSVEEYFKGGNK